MKYPQLVSMPSAVSDWLQEQLEARGIDSVLYTRYVLSLLHSHPVDLIYQDDLRLSHLKKEVGKSNGGRKRSRKSSSDWWRYAQADAEQIKRSAAVECLVSASDQNCEIESLVDELCEKLKEVESTSTTPISEQDTPAEEQSDVRKLTPQELAEKYYAAFPPLCPQSPTESKLLALIPKWKPTISPIKMKVVKKQGNRTVGYENKLHAKENRDMKARTQNKQRLSLISRTKNTISLNNTAFANWDFTIFNRRFGAPKLKHSPDTEHKPLDQCVEVDQEIWENSDVNIYEDLPVDIKELLESPLPSEDNVKKVNTDTRKGKKPEYIQYGTNIMSSIWSTDSDVAGSKNFNSVVGSSNDFGLDSKFSSISIDSKAEPVDKWFSGNIPAENKMKALFEQALGLKSPKCNVHSLPNMPEPDNKQYRCSRGEVIDRYTFSLMQINHDREVSSFARVTPRCNETNPFTVQPRKYPFRSSRRSLTFDKDEDLLTSEKSHFKPITEKLEQSSTQYADGATFVISNKLDKVEYKRSESGTMCLENNQGQKKKYFEYKNDEIRSSDGGFVLKFIVSQNNKACQTEEPSELDFDTVKTKFEEDAPEIIYAPETPVEYCTCIDDKIPATTTDDSTICPVHPARPESALGVIWWKYEMKICEKCNNNNYTSTSADWSNKGQTDSDWDDQGLREIWSGEEICETCSKAGGIPRPTANLQLREDIIQDGEELFSDLRIVQKNYMEELPLEESPLAEPSIDLTELVSTPPKERKRRHSFILEQHQSAWSFASRLEEDCLIQMSTLPTLRSVTL